MNNHALHHFATRKVNSIIIMSYMHTIVGANKLSPQCIQEWVEFRNNLIAHTGIGELFEGWAFHMDRIPHYFSCRANDLKWLCNQALKYGWDDNLETNVLLCKKNGQQVSTFIYKMNMGKSLECQAHKIMLEFFRFLELITEDKIKWQN